jgi:hypothetical protein
MKKIALLSFLLFADIAFAQTTFIPVTVAFPEIVVGGDAAGQNYVTLLQVVNNNSYFTTGHIQLFSDSGTPLAALFDGLGPQTTLDVSLNSGQGRQIQITLNGPVTAGWMEITYNPSDALTTVIVQSRSGTTLQSEVGIDPAFDTLSAIDFPAETAPGLNAGIALANPNTSTAYFLARLWDPNSGAVSASATVSLPAGGHTAKYLTDMFPSVLSIGQIRAKISIDQCSDSTCTSAGGNGFFAAVVRAYGTQFTVIPVEDRPPDGDQIRILPQIAVGGPPDGLNIKTILYLTTNVSSGVFGTIDIFDNDGNPLVASADGASPASSMTLTVPGNRVTRIVLTGDRTLRAGWLRLTLSGGVHLIASAVFQTLSGSNLVSETSVFVSPQAMHGLLYVKSQAGLANVGVALANPQTTPATITLKLFNKDGFVAGSQDVNLPPNGHVSQFVTDLFPQLASVADFDGALSMSSASQFSALAVRETGDKVAALPISSDGIFRPAITAVRVTKTSRSPAQVNFEIDVIDYDKNLAVSGSTMVSGTAYVDFGSSVGYDVGPVSIDGTKLVNQTNGTLTGTFQPPDIPSGAIPSGTQAAFYIYVMDADGNQSNFVGTMIKF